LSAWAAISPIEFTAASGNLLEMFTDKNTLVQHYPRIKADQSFSASWMQFGALPSEALMISSLQYVVSHPHFKFMSLSLSLTSSESLQVHYLASSRAPVSLRS
jgi:hypothetical protein